MQRNNEEIIKNHHNKDCESIEYKFLNIIQSLQYCGLCLNNDWQLEMKVPLNQLPVSITCENVIRHIFRDKVIHLLSRYICYKCVKKLRNSFIFIQDTKDLLRKVKGYLKKLNKSLEQVTQQYDILQKHSLLIIITDSDITNKATKIKAEPNTHKIVSSNDETYICGLSDNMNNYCEVIKHRFLNVLHYSQYCMLCLEKNEELFHTQLKTEVTIHQEKMAIAFQEIITFVFHDEIVNFMSEFICEKCFTKVLDIYIFMHTTIQLLTRIKKYIQIMDYSLENINEDPSLMRKKNLLIILSDDNEDTKIKIEPKIENIKEEQEHICYECNFHFKTQEEWETHRNNYHMDFTPQCVLCGLILESKYMLSEHVKICAIVKCQICDAHIPKSDLNEHLMENHSNEIFSCDYCSLISFSVKDFKTHLKICKSKGSPNKNKYQCIMCLKIFKGNEELKSHKCKYGCPHCTELPCIHYRYLVYCREQADKGFKRAICLDCDYSSRLKEHLIGHINREHLNYHPFICTDCGQQFYTKEVFSYHVRKFHSDVTICKYCDKTFVLQRLYEKHLKLCAVTKRKYQCKECVANFDEKVRLDYHYKLHHTSEIYPCDLCNRKFPSEVRLQEHKSKVHNGLQAIIKNRHLQCGTCLKTFKNMKDYRNHIKKHGADRKFICGVCRKEFESLLKLQWHRGIHKKERRERIKCDVCDREVSVASMKIHMLYHFPHPYICEACGKSFPTKGSFNLHIRIHEEKFPCPKCLKLIKPHQVKRHYKEYCKGQPKWKIIGACPKLKRGKYVCALCDYNTRNKHEMESHNNKVHLKQKPYLCDVCNECFWSKHELNVHMLKHKLDKVFTCDICERKYLSKQTLISHLKSHEEKFECDLCDQTFSFINLLQVHKIKNHMMT